MKHFLTILTLFFLVSQSLPAQTKIREITSDEFRELISDPDKSKWNFKGGKPAIVQFSATWCGPCKQFEPIITAFWHERSNDFDIYKVDVDKEPKLTKRYGINSVPSFLFIPLEGQPRKVSGGLTKEDFEKRAEDLLIKKR